MKFLDPIEPISIRFLIGTGARITILDWQTENIADIAITKLPRFLKRSKSVGLGGKVVPTFIMSETTITFDSSIGPHSEHLSIHVLSDKSQDGESLFHGENILGIVFLKNFDIKFKNEYAYLIKN